MKFLESQNLCNIFISYCVDNILKTSFLSNILACMGNLKDKCVFPQGQPYMAFCCSGFWTVFSDQHAVKAFCCALQQTNLQSIKEKDFLGPETTKFTFHFSFHRFWVSNSEWTVSKNKVSKNNLMVLVVCEKFVHSLDLMNIMCWVGPLTQFSLSLLQSSHKQT